MSEGQGFVLHPLAAQDITDIWEFRCSPASILIMRKHLILNTLHGLSDRL